MASYCDFETRPGEKSYLNVQVLAPNGSRQLMRYHLRCILRDTRYSQNVLAPTRLDTFAMARMRAMGLGGVEKVIVLACAGLRLCAP